jgi:DNA-binding NarL/FixJ family response regulator
VCGSAQCAREGSTAPRYMPAIAGSPKTSRTLSSRPYPPTRATVENASKRISIYLTPRESKALALLAAGRTHKEIGQTLHEITAKLHVRNILRKLGMRNRVKAANVAPTRSLVRRRR